MNDPVSPADPNVALTPGTGRRFPRGRVAAALALSAVLVYPVGRTLVVGLLAGFPEARFGIAVTVGLIILTALTWNLAGRIGSRGASRWVEWGLHLLWIVLGIVLLSLSASSSFGFLVAGPLFLVSIMAILRLGWIAFDPSNLRRRLLVALGWLVLAGLFPVLIRVTGLTGGNRVQFAWRLAAPDDPGAQLSVRENVDGDPQFSILIEPRPSEDSPQYLGPERSGVHSQATLNDDWNSHPPREVWRREVGAGWGSFAVVGDYAFTQEQRGERECVVCYALADGSEQWVHSDHARFESAMGGIGPRATPTFDPSGGVLFTVGGTGWLNCLRADTGSCLWTVHILDDNGGQPIDHGVCGSPLVVGDRVIVSPTGMNPGCLAAYDVTSGQRVWRGGRHTASYGSPMLLTLHNVPQVVVTTREGIEAVEPRTGESLWRHAWTNDYRVNCSQPVVVDAGQGRILMTTGYNGGSLLLEVRPDESSGWQTREVWARRGVLKTKFTSPLLHEGFVYGLDDGILACLDVETGKQRWKGGRYRHGQVLLAGNLLIIQAEDPGDVVLVRANSQRLEELARIPALSTLTWNVPVLAGRHLLVRNNREAVCLELP